MKTGERIKQRREYMQMTASELAERVGESKQTIYKYENGIVENIPLEKLEAIAKILDCNPADLTGWNDGRQSFSLDEFKRNLLTDDENTLLTGFRAASRERREDMLDMARKAIREKERSSNSEREGIA